MPLNSRRNPLNDIDRATQQRFRGFRRPKRGVRRQRHILQLRERMIRRERLVVKDIKACVPDMTAFQRGNQCSLVGAPRAVLT